MKERPILFSAPMVNAILDGRKTQTRRVLKKQPPFLARIRHGWFNAPIYGFTDEDCPAANWWKIKSPYGQPGDRLWVRESWHNHNTHWTTEKPNRICYRADGGQCAVRWKPSIHMPRWASRITLEVLSVSVERLQEIEDYDCIKEGINLTTDDGSNLKDDFEKLWDSINGKKQPWSSNPWVWRIEFRKIG